MQDVAAGGCGFEPACTEPCIRKRSSEQIKNVAGLLMQRALPSVLVRRQHRHSSSVAQSHHRVVIKPGVIAVQETAPPPLEVAATPFHLCKSAHIGLAWMVCLPVTIHIYAFGIVVSDPHHLERW